MSCLWLRSLTLHRIEDISPKEHGRLIGETPKYRPSWPKPGTSVVTLNNCLSGEDGPVDPESDVSHCAVRYAREQDGIRHEPKVSLMRKPNSNGTIVSVSEYEAHRSVCSVYLPIDAGGYVYVSETEPGANVWVNGSIKVIKGVKVLLSGNCILTLNGRMGIALQVSYKCTPQARQDLTVRLNSKRKIVSDIDVQRIRDDARKSFVAESTCSVCHEVIVRAVSGDGCTHKYCDQCIRKCQHVAESLYILCPQCRDRTIKWFHDPNMDAMIWAGALDGKFKGDLAKTYLQRRAEFGEGVATHDERMCVLDIRYKTGE